ncbi:hypothetical protein ACHAW5_009356 [Stephanodiscus triporus]|uniref:Mitochondrial carrier protein n=1 Tax=Stephanodiscus triporus TaxID=2934178 RepID=A0ABD3N815_9STRA
MPSRTSFAFAVCLLAASLDCVCVRAWTSLPSILYLTERNLRHFSHPPIISERNATRTTDIHVALAIRGSPSSIMAPKDKSSSGGIEKAARAVRDGLAASMASIVSVFLLMWLRTSMSYQHVKGVTMSVAIRQLYEDGGVGRFYRGLIPALIMMPLSRFGDIFSNRVANEFGPEWLPAAAVTMFASSLAAGWRILISPADTIKTMMQVHGASGMSHLRAKISKSGFSALFEGAVGASVATWMGHYPWFVTHNFLEGYCVRNRILDAHLKVQKSMRKNVRRALTGLASSLVSDVCSNAIRVLKTYKQTSLEPIGYVEAAARIIDQDGLTGFLFRGLSSKLAANALNAIIFTVVWKAISERLAKRQDASEGAKEHSH